MQLARIAASCWNFKLSDPRRPLAKCPQVALQSQQGLAHSEVRQEEEQLVKARAAAHACSWISPEPTFFVPSSCSS